MGGDGALYYYWLSMAWDGTTWDMLDSNSYTVWALTLWITLLMESHDFSHRIPWDNDGIFRKDPSNGKDVRRRHDCINAERKKMI